MHVCFQLLSLPDNIHTLPAGDNNRKRRVWFIASSGASQFKEEKKKNGLPQSNSNHERWFLSLAMSAIWSWLFCMLINCSDLFSVGRVFRPRLLLSNRRKIPCVWNIWRCEGSPRRSETVNNYVSFWRPAYRSKRTDWTLSQCDSPSFGRW